jgi:hypothetical protein
VGEGGAAFLGLATAVELIKLLRQEVAQSNWRALPALHINSHLQVSYLCVLEAEAQRGKVTCQGPRARCPGSSNG